MRIYRKNVSGKSEAYNGRMLIIEDADLWDCVFLPPEQWDGGWSDDIATIKNLYKEPPSEKISDMFECMKEEKHSVFVDEFYYTWEMVEHIFKEEET